MEQTIQMKTNFCIRQTHLKWAIEDWDKIYQRTGAIRSRDFTLKGLGAKIYFTFNLDVNEIDRLEPVLGVVIEHNQPFLRPDVNAYVYKLDDIKTSMIDTHGQEEEENTCHHMFLLPDEHNIQDLYIVNNTLTIYCDIKYYEHINKVEELSCNLPFNGLRRISQAESVQENEVFSDETESSDEISNGFSDHLNISQDQSLTKYSFNNNVKFFEESRLCDVTFAFESEEVKAHRIVLSVTSRYFRRKFQEEAADESENYRIDCTHDKYLTPSILRDLLEYIYTDKTFEDVRSNIGITKLYILAKEYEMDKLKESCEAYMRELV